MTHWAICCSDCYSIDNADLMGRCTADNCNDKWSRMSTMMHNISPSMCSMGWEPQFGWQLTGESDGWQHCTYHKTDLTNRRHMMDCTKGIVIGCYGRNSRLDSHIVEMSYWLCDILRHHMTHHSNSWCRTDSWNGNSCRLHCFHHHNT